MWISRTKTTSELSGTEYNGEVSSDFKIKKVILRKQHIQVLVIVPKQPIGLFQHLMVNFSFFSGGCNDLDKLWDKLLFADDTAIYSSGGTPYKVRLEALHTFSLAKKLFSNNELALNESKTHVMICT